MKKSAQMSTRVVRPACAVRPACRQAGFTLLELLIVLVLLGVTVVPLYFSYTRQQAKQGLKASAQGFSDIVRRAHIFAREAKDKKSWGIKRNSGTSYSLISQGKDSPGWNDEQLFLVEPLVFFKDSFNIVFNVGTGETDSDAVVTLEDKYGDQLIVNIYESGLVEVRSP